MNDLSDIDVTHTSHKTGFKLGQWYSFFEMEDDKTILDMNFVEPFLTTRSEGGYYEGLRRIAGNNKFQFGAFYRYLSFTCVRNRLPTVKRKCDAVQYIIDFVEIKKSHSVFYGFMLENDHGMISPVISFAQNYTLQGYLLFTQKHQLKLKNLKWVNL
jgi:hypothetical protein